MNKEKKNYTLYATNQDIKLEIIRKRKIRNNTNFKSYKKIRIIRKNMT